MILDAAIAVLSAAAPADKVAAAAKADALREGQLDIDLSNLPAPPDQPARPDRPILANPGDVPKRRFGSVEGRISLLHAVAHIEFNAIDLAFDMAARFASEVAATGLEADAFVEDWVRIGGEEARHFSMIEARLNELGAHYGDHLAHNGLWESAEKTKENVLARLAIAPLILEARGLDVTPDMMARLRSVGDDASADILAVIYREEVGHVACGKHWFDRICAARNLNVTETFHKLRKIYFAGELKPPFNHDAREKAGLNRPFYEPI